MNKNIFKLLAIVCCCVFTLSSCTYLPKTNDDNSVNMPEPKLKYDVPIGDSESKYTYTANIYLPDKFTYKLNKKATEISLSLSDKIYEEIVEYVLGYKEDEVYASPTYNVNIGLYGETPVCIYKNHAIVNLTANALSLDREQFYLLATCISETLIDFANIKSVNVLVADRAVSMNLLSNIPISALEKQTSNAPYADYIRLIETRDGLNRGLKAIEIPTSLYFPTNLGEGILAESRTISFTDSDPSYMITQLLRELSKGSRLYANNISIPNFVDLLSVAPEISETNEGGNMLTLKFKSVLEDVLSNSKLNINTALAMISYTITSFYPDTAGVKIYIGDRLVDQLLPDSINYEESLISAGIFTRKNMAKYLLKQTELYFSDISGEKLLPVIRNTLFKNRINVRNNIIELSKGPAEMDYIIQAIMPSMPFEIKDSDILGNSLQDNTIIINFSKAVHENIKTLNAKEERIFVYSIVNTLCTWEQIKAVQFLFEGKTLDYIAGELYWATEFYPNYKITY